MFILAFSLDWFTTVPGVLVSLGVVLLIVAIILFVTGNKKPKTDKGVEGSVENTVSPVEPVVATEVQATSESVQVEEQPKFEDIPIGTPGVDPINPEDTTNGFEAVQETDDAPTEIKIEEPGLVDPVEVNVPEVSVYGGTDPADSLQTVNVEEVKMPTIYGGNDPLEATQNLPKVDEQHVPYGGAINEIKIEEPVVVDNLEVTENIAEPSQVETPAVEEAVSFEMPAAPVEIPAEVVEIPVESVDTLTDEQKVEVDPDVVEKPSIEEL